MNSHSSESERWIDAHSVTCALCGGLADERETVSLWADDYDDGDPDTREMHALVSDLPDGEAHMDCFEDERGGDSR